MKRYHTLVYLLIAVVLTSCKPEIDNFIPSSGMADFSRFIAVGNSLTAGYADGELYKTGQLYSFPNIIAQQMKTVGGGEFIQPLMYDDLGFGNRRVLNINVPKDCFGVAVEGATPTLGPVLMRDIINQFPDPRNFARIEGLKPVNNLGIPGAKSFHLLVPYYGLLNPYYARFATNPNSISPIEQAYFMNPTFFSLWIGQNDVLTYALAGGMQDSITPISTFAYAYKTLVEKLISNGAKGVVANIPDISNLPYFTTIPYNGLVLTSEQQVAGLNAGYEALGITFNIGLNPFIIQDENSQGGVRQIKSTELVLLSIPQDSLKCAGWGSLKPIPKGYFLTEQKIEEIKNATNALNDLISSIAQSNNLAFVDANKIYKDAKTGLVYDGIKFNLNFVTGGLFSLDGIHLCPRGNAITANFFIQAINEKYAAKIPLVNVSDYQGIIFP